MSVDRGFTWMDDETIALIDIFSKEDIQLELNGSKRNIAIYERIASELSDVGFRRTAYQCREKIKRLRKEYQFAKYCVQSNITPKKPMKHFELVDRIFNRESEHYNSNINLLSPDHEGEFHFALNPEQESDASNSCTDSMPPHIILPGPSCSPLLDEVNSPPNLQTDSNDTLLMNGEQSYDCSDKDSPLEESECPWVPNVVLVENDLDSGDLEHPEETKFENHLNQNQRSRDCLSADKKESSFIDSDAPTAKRKKYESSQKWLKKIVDDVTDSFLKHQESVESRFLERLTHLEEERMKRDEATQRLWIEFEERRRKEEQQHELKMMSVFGQFLRQMKDNAKT